jgi:hypothetical protein
MKKRQQHIPQQWIVMLEKITIREIVIFYVPGTVYMLELIDAETSV